MPVSDQIDEPKLKRSLDNRHIQLIAFGGAIGTGLFMGAGKTIHVAGPSIILVYAITAFMLFFVMRAMGELLLSNAHYYSFVDFAGDLIGPWAGFFIGWTYWLCWIVTAVADVIAVGGYARFWYPNIAPWLPAMLCIGFIFLLNVVAVKLFAEFEFWFSLIKVAAIIGLILLGGYMITTHFITPEGNVSSLGQIWNHGNIFPRGLSGFFSGFQLAIFSFVGLELAGIAAAEVKNPEQNLPKAINAIPIRVIIFYILALAVIMAVTPWNEVSPDSSPFVRMFTLIGMPAAAGIVNFIVLTAGASAANSGLFSTSRMTYRLAKQQAAPAVFAKLAAHKVPVNAIIFSCLSMVAVYTSIGTIPSIMSAFTLITAVSAILFIFVWSFILFSYMSYRLNHKALHENSHYKMPGGVAMCIIVLLFFAFTLGLMAVNPETFVAFIASVLWCAALVAFYFIWVEPLNRSRNQL